MIKKVTRFIKNKVVNTLCFIYRWSRYVLFGTAKITFLTFKVLSIMALLISLPAMGYVLSDSFTTLEEKATSPMELLDGRMNEQIEIFQNQAPQQQEATTDIQGQPNSDIIQDYILTDRKIGNLTERLP